MDTAPLPQITPSPTPPGLPVTVIDSQTLKVEDVTAQKEAERKRKEEAERLKREAAQKAAEAAVVEPTPAPEEVPIETPATPTPTPEPEKSENKDEKPTPTPAPVREKPATPAPPEKGTTAPEGAGETKPTETKSLYRVRIGGSYRSRDEAEKTIELLRGRGYAAVIKADLRGGKKVYHVQVGAYSDPKSAERTKAEMENNGFDASIH